jgi:transposase-like protein
MSFMKLSPYASEKRNRRKQEALELYKQGLSFRSVSKALGMSHQWVKNAVDELTLFDKK